MSFTKVRIVKKFSIKKNITFNITSKKDRPNIIFEEKIIDYTNMELDSSTIPEEHYIGLVFCNSHCINIDKITESKKKIFLNKTQVYVMDTNIPILKISKNEFNENLKFKKYIREALNTTYCIKNKYINTIKLFETYGNYHVYFVLLNNTKCLSNGISSLNQKYDKFSWNIMLDFYYKDINNKNPKQKEIIQQIYKNYTDNTKLYQNKTIDLPDYIQNYKIYYKKILAKILDTM